MHVFGDVPHLNMLHAFILHAIGSSAPTGVVAVYSAVNIPLLLLARQSGDRPDSPTGDLDGVPAHSSPSAALDLIPGHVVVFGARRVQFTAILGVVCAVEGPVEGDGIDDHGDPSAAPRHRDRFARLTTLLDHFGQSVPRVAHCYLSHVPIVQSPVATSVTTTLLSW